MSFAWRVQAFKKKSAEEVDKQIRKIVIDLFTGIILSTPVDTGRARGNWQVGTTPITATLPNTDPSGASAISGVMGKLSSGMFKGKDNSIWLCNNLPYIGRLETGYSGQAPRGMVALNLQRVIGKYSK